MLFLSIYLLGTMDADYELPDGQIIKINNIRFRCPEALFHPSFLGKEDSPYLHEMVENSIMKCPNECRKDMYAQLVLAGGSSLYVSISSFNFCYYFSSFLFSISYYH